MKQFIFILSILILASCSQNTPETNGSIMSTDGGHFDSIMVSKDKASDLESKPFSNPVLIYGSDFGNYFQSMFERGKYDEMLAFTSSESIELYGEDAILDYYENEMQFGYELGKVKSKNVEGGVTTLNYKANIDATKVVIKIDVVIENDSCKIVLPKDLKIISS
jgi:hypothetical protein